MDFEFATAGRVRFGRGVVAEAGPAARDMGTQALVVTGGNPDRAKPLWATLEKSGVPYQVFRAKGEPTLSVVQAALRLVKDEKCDMVIGFGGGSAMDCAKAVAALAANPGDPLDYLEVVGRGRPLACPPLPCIAIPTTAGTGAEVTRNAVLSVPEKKVKVSLRHPLMLPRLALVDPTLTVGLPAAVTAFTGLDALTQLIEAFVCTRSNPLTDAFCMEGLQRAARSLDRAVRFGHDAEAREDMAMASLMGGLALANAGLGAAHGIAAPIGGICPVPHGVACALLLPPVILANLAALHQDRPDNRTLVRYSMIASILTGHEGAVSGEAADWVMQRVRTYALPGLSQYGVTEEMLPQLAVQALQSSSMKANPVPLNEEDVQMILMACME